jgi:hypothetical protein
VGNQESLAKRMEPLHQLMPTATTIAILVNPNNSNASPDTWNAQIAARGIEPSISMWTRGQTRTLGAEITAGMDRLSGRKRSCEHGHDLLQLRLRDSSLFQNGAHVQISRATASRSGAALAAPFYQPAVDRGSRIETQLTFQLRRSVSDDPFAGGFPGQSGFLAIFHDRRQPALDPFDRRRIRPAMAGDGG